MARPWAPIFIPHRLDGPVLDALLPAQVAIAQLNLLENPSTPPLYWLRERGRLSYKPDKLGEQEFWLAPKWIIDRGGADCKSLACWRAAELRLAGELAATPKYVRCGEVFHVFVERASGEWEDPSTLLGMPFPREWAWPPR